MRFNIVALALMAITAFATLNPPQHVGERATRETVILGQVGRVLDIVGSFADVKQRRAHLAAALEERQSTDLPVTTNISGADCNTACGGSPETGPNEADCVVLINQLSVHGSATFTVDAHQVKYWTNGSCGIALYVSRPVPPAEASVDS